MFKIGSQFLKVSLILTTIQDRNNIRFFIDRCDEIIQIFEAQALATLQDSKNGANHLDKYAQYGCQHEVITQRDMFGWFWLNSPVKYEFNDGKLTIEPNAFYTDETNTPENELGSLPFLDLNN